MVFLFFSKSIISRHHWWKIHSKFSLSSIFHSITKKYSRVSIISTFSLPFILTLHLIRFYMSRLTGAIYYHTARIKFWTIYKALLPFICKTASDLWQLMLVIKEIREIRKRFILIVFSNFLTLHLALQEAEKCSMKRGVEWMQSSDSA